MLFHLNLRSTADYDLFLRAKSLPRYRCQGHTIDVPDEYVHLLGITSNALQTYAYIPEPFLFDYQRDITSIAIRKQKFAIFAQCGLGKTLCLLSYAKHVASILGPNRCVLIVSPLMVVRQTIGEAQRFYGDSLPIQRVPAANLQSFLSAGSGIGITNYEAIREGLHPGQLGSMCLDECFVAGTLVDTPSGPKPIESLNVGDEVCNAFGVDKVIATKYRQMREIAVVKFQDGRKLTCSTNHPVLCRNGWIPVSALVPGDFVYGTTEAMHVLQKGFASREGDVLQQVLLSELAEPISGRASDSVTQLRMVRQRESGRWQERQQKILQPILLSEMAHEPTRTSGQSSYSRSEGQKRSIDPCLVRGRLSRGGGQTRNDSISESDQRPRGTSQDFCTLARNWPRADNSWWQWQAPVCAAGRVAGKFGRWLASRVRDFVRTTTGRLSHLLQGGHWESFVSSRDRSGWIQPCCRGQEGTGSQEGNGSSGAWVDSVEIYKSGSVEFSVISEGKDSVTLYDIEVERHPSFSVSGLAVHNSSLLKSHYGAWGQRLIELGRGLPYKLCLTGTPAPNDRIEYANHAVFLDQFPTINAFLARYFVNRGQTQNRWELKPHALRPFYTSLSSWCIFLENPATYGWSDNVGNIPPISVNIHDVPLTDEQRDLIFAAGGNMYGCPSGIKSRAILSQLAKGKYKDHKVSTNKPQFIRDLVSTWPEESTIVWCRFNHEQDELEKVFPRAASLRGSTSDEEREQAIAAFQRGEVKQLISKDKLIGFGLNLQVATRQVFSSCEDSWERYHQCVKRSNRIGSTRPLNVHLVVTELERPMMENVLRKADRVDHDTIEQEKLFSEVGLGLKGVVNV